MPPEINDRSPLLQGFTDGRPRVRHTTVHRIWLGVRRSSLLLGIFFVFYILYLCLGAVVFGSMEEPMERQLRAEIRNRIDKFLYQFPSLSGCSLVCSIQFQLI